MVNKEEQVVVVEWTSNPVNDMFADATLAAILHAYINPIPDKSICLQVLLKVLHSKI